MNCPACGKSMVEEDFGGVRVDVCKNGCKGIWFDWQELIRLDEKHEGLGKALQQALKSPRVNEADRGQLECPRCGLAMHAHKYTSAKEVNVDECYGCGGFFLDSGELREIREKHISEEEREAYVQKLLDETPEYKVMEMETAQLRAQAGRKLGGILGTRFLWGFTAPIPQDLWDDAMSLE